MGSKVIKRYPSKTSKPCFFYLWCYTKILTVTQATVTLLHNLFKQLKKTLHKKSYAGSLFFDLNRCGQTKDLEQLRGIQYEVSFQIALWICLHSPEIYLKIIFTKSKCSLSFNTYKMYMIKSIIVFRISKKYYKTLNKTVF